MLPEHMDKNKKSQAIKEISEEMGIEQDLIVKKMISLRTWDKNTSSKNKNGTDADEVKKPTWPYFDSVSFLNESLTAN